MLWGARFTPSGGGPADGLYAELAQELAQQGVSSFRLFYRMPGAEPGPFEECVLDLLGGVSFLSLSQKEICRQVHSDEKA